MISRLIISVNKFDPLNKNQGWSNGAERNNLNEHIALHVISCGLLVRMMNHMYAWKGIFTNKVKLYLESSKSTSIEIWQDVGIK